MARRSRITAELDRIAQKAADPDAELPMLDPVPDRNLVKHAEVEIVADNTVNLSPKAVLERIRMGMTAKDVDDIREHWKEMWKTSSNPAWARFFAEHMLPNEQAPDSPLERFLQSLEVSKPDYQDHQTSVENELAGYLDDGTGKQDYSDV